MARGRFTRARYWPVYLTAVPQSVAGGVDGNVTAVPFSFSLALAAPSVAGDGNVAAVPFHFDLALPAPAVAGDGNVTAVPFRFDLALPVPAVAGNGNVTAPPFAFSLVLPAPTVTATANPTINAVPFAFSLVLPAPAVQGDLSAAGDDSGGGKVRGDYFDRFTPQSRPRPQPAPVPRRDARVTVGAFGLEVGMGTPLIAADEVGDEEELLLLV